MNKVVYLSPSTQDKNIGYGNYGTEEKRMNEITDIIEEILVNHGLTIYRNKPEWSLQQVVKDSNLKKPDLHFAIHSNAGGGRGSEIFAYAPGGEGERAARMIYSELEPLTPTSDRGLKFNPSFYELNSTIAPAVLIEIAFHDNIDDANWILNNIEEVGVALAKGIINYFEIPFNKKENILDKITITELLRQIINKLDDIQNMLNKKN